MCATVSAKVSRPGWGALYGATLPQLTALAVAEMSSPPHPLRTVLRFLLGLGTFVGMAVWLRANRAAIDLQDWCDCAGRQMTVRVIESRRPAPASAPAVSGAVVEEELEPAQR